MARFAANAQSEGVTIGTITDQLNTATQAAYNAVTAAGPFTLTAAQFVNAIYQTSGQTSAVGVTTPTAAQIVAALPNAQVGSKFEFVLINGNTSSGAVTITGGTNVTITYPNGSTVAVTKSQIFRGVVTNATAGAEAVTLYGLLYGGA